GGGGGGGGVRGGGGDDRAVHAELALPRAEAPLTVARGLRGRGDGDRREGEDEQAERHGALGEDATNLPRLSRVRKGISTGVDWVWMPRSRDLNTRAHPAAAGTAAPSAGRRGGGRAIE